LGFAIAERPVFPGSFDKVDEEILRPQAGSFCKNFGHALVEFSFLLRLPARAQRDLNEDNAIGAMNTEILGIVDEAFGCMFRDYPEAVVRRDGDGLDHRAMNAIGKRFLRYSSVAPWRSEIRTNGIIRSPWWCLDALT
jgi:hypothetical protein